MSGIRERLRELKVETLARYSPQACLALILIAHFILLLTYFAPAIATPDANGYWAQGSLLATTGRTWFETESMSQYVGMHWLPDDSGRYYSRYPPGLAVPVAIVYGLFGFKASVLLNPMLATASLVGLYLLFHRWLTPWWSVAGAGVLAMNPVFNEHALWCFAHMAVTCCLIWGLFFLVRWSEDGRLWRAFAAGLLLGCIPTMRYPEVLFGLGVAVFLVWHLRDPSIDSGSRSRVQAVRGCLALGAGAAVPLLWLLVRNQLAFGAFYRTGYGLADRQIAFGWGYFQSHFADYIRGLLSDGVGLFFPLGVIGLSMLCCIRRWRRTGVLMVALAVPSLLLYMAYYWDRPGRGGASMRFLLPTFVCYIFGGIWFLARTTPLGGATERAAAPLKATVISTVLVLQLVWGGFKNHDRLKQLRYSKAVLARVTDVLEEKAGRNDVVIADRQVLQHLDFVRRWRLADLQALRPVGRFDRRPTGGGPDAPMARLPRKRRARAEQLSGLDPRQQEYLIALDLDAWARDNKVYYVGPEDALEQMRGEFFNQRSFRMIARVPLPEPPPAPESRQRPGMTGPKRFPLEGGPGDPGGRPGRFPGRGGGLMQRWGFMQDAREFVVAEWTARPTDEFVNMAGPSPTTAERRPQGLPEYAPGPRRVTFGEQPDATRPPPWLAERLRNLRALLARLSASGRGVEHFWPREREGELRRLLDERRFGAANELLDDALEDFNRGPGPPPRP